LQAEENMKTVRITMEGGVIQDVACPEGVKVVVRDYDIMTLRVTTPKASRGSP
jgi:hypothetical protein